MRGSFVPVVRVKALGKSTTNTFTFNKMKKYHFMLLATGLVCLNACQKVVNSNEEIIEDADIVTYIHANEESSSTSKASIDNLDASFSWNTNDRIAVYADGYKISDPLADTYNGTNEATFAFSGANAVTESNRADFAIFPASLVWDGSAIRTNSASNHTSTSLTLTLPASYTLEQVQDELSPCPMIAANAPNGDLSFKHLCALLRVEVSDVPATTRRLVFVFNGNKVQGEFTLTGVDPGTSSIETAVASGSNNTITVFTPDIDAVSTLTINLPLPTGTYEYITIGAYDKAEGGLPIYTQSRLIKKSSPGTWTSDRLSSRKISAALSQVAFSVSSTKKVIFSPGNLQAKTEDLGAHWTWDFAPTQYTAIKNNTANTTITGKGTVSANGTIDLFGYSTDHVNNFFGIIKSNRDNYYSDGPTSGAFVDWGTNSIGEYAPNYWHTMSKSEWEYLLDTRDAPKFAKVSVNGVDGLLLFPDQFTWNMTSIPSTVDNINGIYNSTNCSISLSSWNNLEAAGVVFLPGTGYRSQNENTVNNLSPARGYYWFSDTNGKQSGSGTTYDNNSTFYLYFGQGNIWSTTSTMTKRCGVAVRLVHEL